MLGHCSEQPGGDHDPKLTLVPRYSRGCVLLMRRRSVGCWPDAHVAHCACGKSPGANRQQSDE